MTRWLCEECGRFFARPNQSHTCEPGMSLASYLARQPEHQRPIHQAVLAVFARHPILVDPVDLGIMIKRARTFCELRPKQSNVSLCFKLSREVASQRFARAVKCSAHRMAYFVALKSAADVDAELREWLLEAYEDSPP
jgi:Domain of unknown function (DUF5655)